MTRRLATSALSLVLAFCAAGVPNVAMAAPRTTTANTKVKVKLISFNLRNDSKTPLLLQMGEQQVTVAPGVTTTLKLATGQQIVTVNATERAAAGSVLGTVGNELQGNTLVVN